MMMMKRLIINNAKTNVITTAHTSTSSSSLLLLQQQQVRTVRRLPNKKVIILKDHGSLFANDIVIVRPGYMRNFLYPNRIADYATPENLEKHTANLTPQVQKDLEEKKKGERITKMLKSMTMIEVTRATKPQIVDIIGQRRELTKKIDLFELCKIISEYFSIVVQPFDILQVYQPDADRLIAEFDKEGLSTSGLYDVQFKTSQFSTGVVKLNIVSVVDKAEVERRRLARLERDRVETEMFEQEQKDDLEREKKREEARARRVGKQQSSDMGDAIDLDSLDPANRQFMEARLKKDTNNNNNTRTNRKKSDQQQQGKKSARE